MTDSAAVDTDLLVAAMVVEHEHADRELVPPPANAYDEVLRTGRALGLAGDVHDAVIVRTPATTGLALTTVDRGLHRLADGVVPCTLLPG